MKSPSLILFLAAAVLSTGCLASRSFLLRRDLNSSGVDNNPTGGNGSPATDTTVVFQETTVKTTQAVTLVQDSCKKGDTETVYSSLTTLQTSVTTVAEVTQQSAFSTDTAKSVKEYVVQMITSFSVIVSVLSTYTDVENGCHESLKKIVSHYQLIVNVYVKLGFCLEEDVKNSGNFHAEAFAQLNLDFNLKGETTTTTNTPTQPDQNSLPQDTPSNDAEGN